jgi:hypothetical protein
VIRTNSASASSGSIARQRAETVRSNRHAFDHRRTERFVAGLHVGEIEIGEHVRQEREDAVADGVPEVEHSPRRAGETRSVDDIAAAIENRLEELSVVVGIVLEVGVLDEDDIPRGDFDPVTYGGALPFIDSVDDQAKGVASAGLSFDHDLIASIAQPEPGELLARAVGGAIVDDDELLIDGDLADTTDDLRDGVALVVGRHNDGELHDIRTRDDASGVRGTASSRVPRAP